MDYQYWVWPNWFNYIGCLLWTLVWQHWIDIWQPKNTKKIRTAVGKQNSESHYSQW